jgi:hypothetical protein
MRMAIENFIGVTGGKLRGIVVTKSEGEGNGKGRTGSEESY